jgi:small subunit ribosomal protein S1
MPDDKEKFRPHLDPSLEREIDDALGDLSLDKLYGFDKPRAPKSEDAAAPAPAKGMRRGKIIAVNPHRDQVLVDFGGKSEGIAPFSQFDTEPKVGDQMDFHVERFDTKEALLILTLKGATSHSVTWDSLEVGQVVEGMVTGMNKGGLELQVKQMRAFMPSGQVDLYFIQDLATFVGQKMQAEVVQFDRDAKNLIVSRRNILEKQKEEARQKMVEEIEVGQMRRGTVRNVTDFGAFVDLGGMDGLIHVSEMSHRRGVKPSEFVKVGDLVDVKIVKFDRETGKLALSLKQMMADPWLGAEAKYSVGTLVTGRITKVENFGAFVEIEEGVEGLLPVSEMSWTRIRHPDDVVKVGDTLRVVVLSIDPVAKRLSFSLKQAGADPWATVLERYQPDMIVSGRVSRVVDFGAFVELEPGLEGLVHVSELSDQRVRTPGDVVKVGQDVKARVLEVDKTARRIGLSIKQAAYAAPTNVPAPTPNASKKKRPQLRGGLDF